MAPPPWNGPCAELIPFFFCSGFRASVVSWRLMLRALTARPVQPRRPPRTIHPIFVLSLPGQAPSGQITIALPARIHSRTAKLAIRLIQNSEKRQASSSPVLKGRLAPRSYCSILPKLSQIWNFSAACNQPIVRPSSERLPFVGSTALPSDAAWLSKTAEPNRISVPFTNTYSCIGGSKRSASIAVLIPIVHNKKIRKQGLAKGYWSFSSLLTSSKV